MSRLLAVPIHAAAMLSWFKDGADTHFRVEANGLPADAKYVRTRYDQWRDQVQVVVETEDERYPITPEGGEPLIVQPWLITEA